MNDAQMNNKAEFHELCCPHLDGGHADATDEWVAYDNDARGYYYLLTDGSYTIFNVIQNSGYPASTIFFASEFECHQHASEYYASYGREYPYMKEWADVSWGSQMATASNTIESKVMEFV